MGSKAPSEAARRADDVLADLSIWPKREVLRIEELPDQQVLSELQKVMEGYNYSWHSINMLLQDQLDKGHLEFTLVDGDVLFEWNNLCDKEREWERKGRLSNDSADFNRDCLINLMILPFQVGLGHKGKLSNRFNWFHSNKPSSVACKYKCG